MAGQQFQYDDSGNTFFYFLTSFVGLIVIPATYYLWPRDQNAGKARCLTRLLTRLTHLTHSPQLLQREGISAHFGSELLPSCSAVVLVLLPDSGDVQLNHALH